ncbi:uncharacterized protein BDV14DRAFT_199027 [Aspergillus stella-maris]|uniref:uncharacterized protein n=1 Tax=Aspergillus stella-maris TaxID=1810926 RepID=UPI003CCE167A
MATLAAGGCCRASTQDKTPASVLADVRALNANTTFLTSTVASRIDPRDVPSLDLVSLVGEPLPDDLLRRWTGHVTLILQARLAAHLCPFYIFPKKVSCLT